MRCLLHIGYHKTGTTWLQRHLFPRTDLGFAFMPEREGTDGRLDGLTPGRFIVEQPLFHYDHIAARARLEGIFADAIERNDVVVISSEQLSGNPNSAGWQSKEYAERLRNTFPEALILVVIREQVSMIRACYTQYIRAGGGLSIDRLLQIQQDHRVPLFDLYYFEYHHLVEHYRKLFGRERVLCLPYEMLKSEGSEYVRRITEFAGVRAPNDLPTGHRENSAGPFLQYPIRRLVNPFVSAGSVNAGGPMAIAQLERPARFLARSIGQLAPKFVDRAIERRMHNKIKEIVRQRYAASNAKLGEMIGIDLARYGYPILPSSAANA